MAFTNKHIDNQNMFVLVRWNQSNLAFFLEKSLIE